MTATDHPTDVAPAPGGTIRRYRLFERIVHWFVAASFVYLLLSGFALAYPRMAWLYDLLGGGQSVRWLHPVAGVAFTVGVVVMLVLWAGQNTFGRGDVEWLKGMRRYATEGHAGVDLDKYNAGQKGFFWFMVLATAGLLLTGIPLWLPGSFGLGLLQVSRLLHHALMIAFGLMFIVHVYLSTVMLPGTMSAMTTGRVTRAWAAWHHPRWFRREDEASRRDGSDR